MSGIADRYARLGSGEYRPVPLPKLQIGDRVWHYTDAHGLLGVVHGRELFATAPVGLNDGTEVLYGQLLVEEVWADERGTSIQTSKQDRHVNNVVQHALSADLLGRVYFVSASLDGDSVSMWQHYAHRGGYAIELNAGETLIPDVGTPARSDLDATWAHVIYDVEEQRSAIRALLEYTGELAPVDMEPDEMKVQADAQYLETLICLLKHPSFSGEREVRMIASVPEGQHGEHYRVRGSTLVPYMKVVAVRPGDGAIVADRSRTLPVVGVRLGPGATSADEYVVSRLLRRESLQTAAISTSTLPLR